MTSRILPPDEWDRLEHVPDLLASLEAFRPDDVQVVVVEDGDRIVAAWAVLRVAHFEGIWIAPEVRGKASVVRSLFRSMLTAVAPWASSWVMTAAGPEDSHVQDLIAQLGGQAVPMTPYVLPLERMERLCR